MHLQNNYYMLKVKTYIKASNIAGLGLFADQFIPKGTLIWQFNALVDKTIDPEILEHLDELERQFIDTYGYMENGKIILCSDNGRYINHSSNPNTDDLIDTALGSITVAYRDIEKDEEIVSNYESFDAEFSSYGFKFNA